MAACAVLPITEARAFDVVSGTAATFAAEMTALLGIAVRAVETEKEAVVGSDVVLCASTTKEPIVLGEWLRPGMFVSSVGSHLPTVRELDGDAIRKAKLVVDSRESALAEAGDVIIAIQEGTITEDHIHANLGEVALGIKPGRERAEEITVFKSVGMAIQDAATALRVYSLAKERGVGTEVEL